MLKMKKKKHILICGAVILTLTAFFGICINNVYIKEEKKIEACKEEIKRNKKLIREENIKYKQAIEQIKKKDDMITGLCNKNKVLESKLFNMEEV